MSPEPKRAGILLRVSTQGQAKQNDRDADIPTQRTACLRFIEQHPDWVFVKEYIEIGISGFKKSIGERDELLRVRDDIRAGTINVLVVFMFDRLGRIEEETPFVVKSFVEMGAEVWSVKEGQRKFSGHVDNLLNYITFWQAEGESKKISQRVTEAMNQMAEQGLYTGGPLPYGYKRVPTGGYNKKRAPQYTLAVNEEEADIVRKVYGLALTRRYGCHRIATYLNRRKIPTRSGAQWSHATIANMLKNPIYKGVKAYNRTICVDKSKRQRVPADRWTLAPVNPEWLIIPEDIWEQVQANRQTTVRHQQKKRTENEQSRGVVLGRTKLLFVGFIYCGCCGAKMHTGYAPCYRTIRGEGRRREYSPVYQCCARSSGKIGCDGKPSYKKEWVEGVVLDEVKQYLDTLTNMDLSGEIKKLRKQFTAAEENRIRGIEREIAAVSKEKQRLENEVVKSLAGESAFQGEVLGQLLGERSCRLKRLQEQLADAQSLLEQKKTGCGDLGQMQRMVPVWREEFEHASLDLQKVLLSKMIERVTVYPDRIDLKLRIQYRDFSDDKA